MNFLEYRRLDTAGKIAADRAALEAFAPAAAGLLATATVREAELVAVHTVRAGKAGKFDIGVYKVASKRNRYFVTVDGRLYENSFISYQVAEGNVDFEYFLEQYYLNTLLAATEKVEELKKRAAQLQAAAATRAERLAKNPNGYVPEGPVTAANLDFFRQRYGIDGSDE